MSSVYIRHTTFASTARDPSGHRRLAQMEAVAFWMLRILLALLLLNCVWSPQHANGEECPDPPCTSPLMSAEAPSTSNTRAETLVLMARAGSPFPGPPNPPFVPPRGNGGERPPRPPPRPPRRLRPRPGRR
ncbi:uncharacterized protein LOC144111087 [Amblyomma americanum]